jgi:hypothetical protein
MQNYDKLSINGAWVAPAGTETLEEFLEVKVLFV